MIINVAGVRVVVDIEHNGDTLDEELAEKLDNIDFYELINMVKGSEEIEGWKK